MTAVVLDLDMLAEALFTSDLQPSDRPGTAAVRQAVEAQVFHLGEVECAARVAQESGDHPDTASRRMLWAHDLVWEAFGF